LVDCDDFLRDILLCVSFKQLVSLKIHVLAMSFIKE
jgi:hypothetical protein